MGHSAYCAALGKPSLLVFPFFSLFFFSFFLSFGVILRGGIPVNATSIANTLWSSQEFSLNNGRESLVLMWNGWVKELAAVKVLG